MVALGIAICQNGIYCKEALSAILTGVLIFLINFAAAMVQFQTVPTADQMWIPFWESLITALTIYAVNKGISYRRSST